MYILLKGVLGVYCQASSTVCYLVVGRVERPFVVGVKLRGLHDEGEIEGDNEMQSDMHNRTRTLKCHKVCGQTRCF